MKKIYNLPINLKENWNYNYGITNSFANALLNNSGNKYNFFNSTSEIPLTIMLFGNIDGWFQINNLDFAPRNNRGWNRAFFNKIRTNYHGLFSNKRNDNSIWNDNELQKLLFKKTNINIDNLILIFELELWNKNFHPLNNSYFKELSFININQKWCCYDAVIILPESKSFIFIESKLTSDINVSTSYYQYTNQLLRELEAGFLLTNHHDSLYKNWSFQYIFICPRKNYEYRQKTYSFALSHLDDTLSAYKKILNNEYNNNRNQNNYEKMFERFIKDLPGKVKVIFWDQLFKIIIKNKKDFFDNIKNYLLETNNNELLNKLKAKFEIANIENLIKDTLI